MGVLPGKIVLLAGLDDSWIHAVMLAQCADRHVVAQFHQGARQGFGDSRVGMGKKVEMLHRSSAALGAVDERHRHFQEKGHLADGKSLDQSFAAEVAGHLVVTAVRTLEMLPRDGLDDASAMIFRPFMLEIRDSLGMLQVAGIHSFSFLWGCCCYPQDSHEHRLFLFDERNFWHRFQGGGGLFPPKPQRNGYQGGLQELSTSDHGINRPAR